MTTMPKETHLPVCIWDVAAKLGEGPIWHAATRSVYFVDIKGRQIHRCSEDGSVRRSWSTPLQTGFIVPVAGGGGSGSFVVGMEDGLYNFDPDSGAFTLLRAIEQDVPTNRFNDGYVDAQGCLWFGSMDDGEALPSGSLYRLGGGAEVRTFDRDIIITNGPAVSPDGKTLYHTDTLGKLVFAFDVQDDGSLANKRVFTEITAGGHPDGMAVDSAGRVWIGIFNGARISRYAADGTHIDDIAFPCSNITKLAFGGDDLRTVYVTTAWKGLSDEQRARQPQAGGLFTFRTDTPGLAQHEFLIEATA